MSTSSIQRQAEKDATEYAAAYMSYGEGAGTRRRLIEGTVEYKMRTIPGYSDAFHKASEKQNMAAHAKKAKTDNRRKNVNASVARNTKAVVTGKYENVNTGILIVGAAAVLLHKTGYDKKIVEVGKRKYKELRQRFRKTTKPGPAPKTKTDNVYRITDVD